MWGEMGESVREGPSMELCRIYCWSQRAGQEEGQTIEKKWEICCFICSILAPELTYFSVKWARPDMALQFTMRKADTANLRPPTLPYLETSRLRFLHLFSTWCSRNHKPVIDSLHPFLHREIRGQVNTNNQEKTLPHLSHSGPFFTGHHWRSRNPTLSPVGDFPISPQHLWAGPLLHMFLTFYILLILSMKRFLPKRPFHWL